MTDSEIKFIDTLELLESQRKELSNWKDIPYKVGKYEVSSLCIETNHCQHYVTDKTTNQTYIMGKNSIFLLCVFNWVRIPHFYPGWL